MIEVKNLTKKYGDNVAVDNVSFTIEDGKIYGFLGPNGAGKSTTMNIITGCLAATSGTVLINGHDIFDEPMKAKKCIGYLPEQPPLYMDMTPEEYLLFVGEAKGLSGDELEDQVNGVIRTTGLEEYRHRLISNLSKGYKQRVGIAQAMLGRPKIIILDEPTVGLDPKQIIEIRELIHSLGQQATVILSSHILSEVSEICDHIMIIARGHLVASDTLDNLTEHFADTNTTELIAHGTENKIKMALNEVPGIEAYTITPHADVAELYDVRIEAKSSVDIREQLFLAFAEAKTPLLSLITSSLSLEDVFLKLTNEAEAQAQARMLLEKEARESIQVSGPSEDDDDDDSQDEQPSSQNGKNDHDDKDDKNDDDDSYTPLFS